MDIDALINNIKLKREIFINEMINENIKIGWYNRTEYDYILYYLKY